MFPCTSFKKPVNPVSALYRALGRSWSAIVLEVKLDKVNGTEKGSVFCTKEDVGKLPRLHKF